MHITNSALPNTARNYKKKKQSKKKRQATDGIKTAREFKETNYEEQKELKIGV